MAAFEYRQAQEIRDCFARHSVRYLFLGKSGAILLGFLDLKKFTAASLELFYGRGRQTKGSWEESDPPQDLNEERDLFSGRYLQV